MARRLRRLGRLLGARRVEETAACARALTGLVGRVPTPELLPGGTGEMSRALLTARVLAVRPRVPWPSAMMRQLDPDDPAFLPPLDLHPVLSARDRTWLGRTSTGQVAWVDGLGWTGVGDGPAIGFWFGEGRSMWPVGRGPGERSERGLAVDGGWEVQQTRGEHGLGVVTTARRGALTLELTHWATRLEGKLAVAVRMRLNLDGPAPRPLRLAVAVRPACTNGVAPVFHLQRTADGVWSADGRPVLVLTRPGDELQVGGFGEPDPWHRVSGELFDVPPQKPAEIEVRCPAGLATAAEVWRATVSPGDPLTRLVVVYPPQGATPSLARTSASSLWRGAAADRKGLLSSGAEFQLTEHQALLDACVQRLLLDPGVLDLGGCVGAVALGRLGFVRRAGDWLARWLNHVRRDGSLPGAVPEAPAILAWAAAEYVRWTGAVAWTRANLGGWRRLLDRLAEGPLAAGGATWFGPEGAPRWTELWRVAALLSSAALLRRELEVQPFALAGGLAREAWRGELGEGPWSSVAGRGPDAAASLLLAAPWLGLVAPDDPAVLSTARHVRAHHWHGGGVLVGGGASPAATALVGAVLDRAEKERPGRIGALGAVAALASPTGALPTARHPYRGAIGEGDDPIAAALFTLLALDRVRASRRRLDILPGVALARNLPTPFGRIDVEDGRVTGRWFGRAPQVHVVSA